MNNTLLTILQQSQFKIEGRVILMDNLDNTFICLIQKNKQLILDQYNFQDLQLKKTIQFQHEKEIQLQNIVKYSFINESHFMIVEKQLKMYFSYKETNKILEITLNQKINLTHFSVEFQFPVFYLFAGWNHTKLSKDLLEINIYTFEIRNNHKQISYGPQPRYNHLSYLKDQRLYIFGGLDKNNQIIRDYLLWTFDIQKNYWFALQLSSGISLEKKFMKVMERQANKLNILNLKNCSIYSLDIFQSLIKQEKHKKQQIFKQNVLNLKKMIKMEDYWFNMLIDCETNRSYRLLIFNNYQQMMKYQMQHSQYC